MSTTFTPGLRSIAIAAACLVALGASGVAASPGLAFAGDNRTVSQGARAQHLPSTPGRTATPSGGSIRAAAKAWPQLWSGSRGTDVRTAQYLLSAAGYDVTADGAFGPRTAGAVKVFQKRHGLKADGLVGPNTWHKLIRTIRQGAGGEAVKAAQVQLAAAGYDVTADGAFGPRTAGAVKVFQKRHGLKADGVVGPNTWHKLVAGTNVPATHAPSGGGRLTNRQALARLAAAGIKHPSGRTSLEGVRARTIQGVIALKKASGCPVTITGGTESGHSAGPRSHARGYKLDLRTRDEGTCVTNWIKNTQRKGKPRGSDPRWHGSLNGISLEYVYETPKRGGVHWDVTFS
ncbi:peptidoglycan-binding protein [Streptomyces sp. NPDC005248]|uniref:peptidoglycan-binding domain-containing protein n=1 Tax=Streptomyces sp. NPDC005248 TaxID=3364709 RepID=UPI0036C5E6D0